jgi:hypothetical protein
MSISRPDGVLNVESLCKEIADLKKRLDDTTKMWVGLDMKNDRLASMYSMKEIECWELQSKVLRLTKLIETMANNMHEHQLNAVREEDFTIAEYFAGR